MDIAKLQLKLADRCYFELLRKCSLNITKAVKSCYPGMQWKFLTPPPRFHKQFSYLLYQAFSSDNFLLNQTSSFINILQIIDRKLIFDTVFAPTTYTKALRAHLANTVWSFQSSWTNGKRFACKHRATRK